MINVKTLSPLYPTEVCKALTATQLISLHLYLHAPDHDGESSDSTFGPYISFMPRNFGAHPLSWLLSHDQATCYDKLLELLPPTVFSSLKSAETRLRQDWRAVCHVLVSSVAVGFVLCLWSYLITMTYRFNSYRNHCSKLTRLPQIRQL